MVKSDNNMGRFMFVLCKQTILRRPEIGKMRAARKKQK